MNKQEFVDRLRMALNGRVSPSLVMDNVNYYQDYINTEIRKGRTEEEVLESLGDPRLIARTLLDTETGANAPYSDAGSAYEQKSGSERVKQKSFKLDFSTWYGKLLAILIAAIVLVILFVLLGILIPIMVIAGIIIYLVRFRPRQ